MALSARRVGKHRSGSEPDHGLPTLLASGELSP